MEIVPSPVESAILGRTILDLRDETNFATLPDLARIEWDWMLDHNPLYVEVKIPVENLAAIHAFENIGFRFAEFQFRLTHKLAKDYDVAAYPCRFELVMNQAQLEEVLEIVETTFTEDRFSVEDRLPKGFGGLRYRGYVTQSFYRADERVYRLVDNESGETIAFKTHRITAPDHALLLLGGVKPEFKRTAAAAMNERFEFHTLRGIGVKRITTHVSGRNLPILNMEIVGLGFRVRSAAVFLRKLYG